MTHRKRTKPLVLGVLAAASIVLAGCGSSSSNPGPSGGSGGSSSTGLKSGQTLTVGYAASLTGRLAIFEQPFLKGLQAAISNINSQGGIDGKVKINLVVANSNSDPQTTGVAAQTVLSKGAHVLITPCDADTSIPASELAQKAHIPVLNSCGSGSELPKEIGSDQFMNVYGTILEGQAMAQFAYNKGYRTACFMGSNDIEYTKDIAQYAQKEFTSLGGKAVCTQSFTLDQPSYTAQATAIAAAKPDVVMTSIFLPASVTFLKNLRAAGYTGPVIGDDGDNGSELFGAGVAAKNFYALTFGFPTEPQTKAFVQVYEKKWGSKPVDTTFASLGGDAADLISAAVTKAQSTEPTAIRNAWANLTNVPGATTSITYAGRNGLPKKNVFIIGTNSSATKFVLVKNFWPSGL